MSFLSLQGSADFSNILMNISARYEIADGLEITPVSQFVSIDFDTLLIRLRSDMDAKVGTKIMSEIQKEATIENLAN